MTVGEALNSVDRLTNSNDWGLIWSDAIPVLAGEVRRLMKENDELDEECTRRQLRIYEQLERVRVLEIENARLNAIVRGYTV